MMRLAKLAAAAALAASTCMAQTQTRGVGVYPGLPSEDFSPRLVPDTVRIRNLALHRPAWHSSAWDYYLTAQLVTDGIKESALPRWVNVTSSAQGELKKHQREWTLDDNWVSKVELRGKQAWLQYELAGGAAPLTISRLKADVTIRAQGNDNQDWSITVQTSDDAKTWKSAGQSNGMARPTGEIHTEIPLKAASTARYYRLLLNSGRPLTWTVGEVNFWNGKDRVHVGGPYSFTSAWMSAGNAEEWVKVDLGAVCTFDRIHLDWLRRPASGEVQTSHDGKNWRTLIALPASGANDDLKLGRTESGRYVRVLMTKAAAERYILSELEVYGRGGPVPKAQPAPEAKDGKLQLSAGNWKVQRDSLVKAAGPALSQPGFADADWIPATVPGTTLVSYWNAGALPDPNFSDNQLMISDSFFYADFWYRNEFNFTPAAGKHTWLNFDGVNWKAEVYLNGEKLGRVEGGFLRGHFDVSAKLKPGKNALAVKIEKNATPGSVKEKTFENPDVNGGALGADNPTYHASIGWDWIPTIRGRDTGIWNDVTLTTTGAVTVEDPLVSTTLPLPATDSAEVTIETRLRNHEAKPISGKLTGRFGSTPIDLAVSLAANETKSVKTLLKLANPKLWWPAGYGAPNLYDVQLSFETAGAATDTKAFKAGVRQFTYNEDGGTLRMWINGRRFIPKGGNWGFPESMLLYRGREYDAALAYHADAHFNMVRNWVGQVGDDEFYEACDRHGIVVWQDFWLANPWDGPDPDDNPMFLRNANDMLLRIRHHASVGLYCGRNEGYPLKALDDSLRASIRNLHPGIHYISSSADDVVTGHGPYRAMSFEYYFTERAAKQMHSELGMPNIVTMDSLRQMMPEDAMWPQGAIWGLHDFCLGGAQGGTSYRERIAKSYGGAEDVNTWISLATFVNYEGYRAMFEAQSKNRMGLLLWMSHPAWPSFVWQVYDWYLEPTSAFFASKKATEPLHIQWNPYSDSVEVVNYSAGDQKGLTAFIEILNLDGVSKWHKTASLDLKEDAVASPIKMEYPAGLSATHFLRLKLTRNGQTVSENFYWRGVEANNFKALRDLPKVNLEARTATKLEAGIWKLTTELRNTGTAPALMVRVKPVRATSKDRILPALFSDNYIALMPGETRTLEVTLKEADARGEKPAIAVEGFNTASVLER